MSSKDTEQYHEIVENYLLHGVSFIEFENRWVWFFEDGGHGYTLDESYKENRNQDVLSFVEGSNSTDGINRVVADFTLYKDRDSCVKACLFKLRSSPRLEQAKGMASEYLKFNKEQISE